MTVARKVWSKSLLVALPCLPLILVGCSWFYNPGVEAGEANPRLVSQWTPDGDHIVVTLDRDTDVNNNHGSTYVVRSDGSSIRRISEGTGKYNLDSLVKSLCRSN